MSHFLVSTDTSGIFQNGVMAHGYNFSTGEAYHKRQKDYHKIRASLGYIVCYT